MRLALGFAYMFLREHQPSVEELRAALDLNPNCALGHACLGLTLAYGSKGSEAVRHVERAIRLSPRDPFFPIFAGMLSFAHFIVEDFAAGLEWGRRSVRQSPEVVGLRLQALDEVLQEVRLRRVGRCLLSIFMRHLTKHFIRWRKRLKRDIGSNLYVTSPRARGADPMRSSSTTSAGAAYDWEVCPMAWV